MARMITILGPTASGKTRVAAVLAARIGGEIVSADSRQVYRRMDIGTGKDMADYIVDGQRVACHLVDIAEPGTHYNLFMYQRDCAKAIADIEARGRTAVLCGGTGLYIEAVLRGYQLPPVGEDKALRASLEGKTLDELTAILAEMKRKNGSAMHNTTDVDTAQRAIRAIEIEAHSQPDSRNGTQAKADALVIGLALDREERRRRITERLDRRLDEGMVDEVKALLDSGIKAEDLMYYGLEYRFVTEYAIGLTTREEMRSRLETAIHQFAKRQMTWFRGMERRGTHIHWIDATMPLDDKVEAIRALWEADGTPDGH